MIHFGFPPVEERHHWIEEVVATYPEPIARAQVGQLTVQQVWDGMVDGMPHGLPAPGDQVLGNTHTWGRTYSEAQSSALLADIEFRKRSSDAKSLHGARCGPSIARVGQLRQSGLSTAQSKSATKRLR
jgi:hypothetical protein